MSKPVVGIDLGTSTSEIALLHDNRPELIQDSQGDRIIPSVVQKGPTGEIIVGSVAKRGAVTYSSRTAQEVKRLMGTDKRVPLGDETYAPEAISAMILHHLKDAAEMKLGRDTVRDVVITVPARFDNPAREATKRAAEMAGLNAVRLINEPTAAALSYGLNHLEDEQKVLVFDFGGGTLDVSILEMFEGVLDVKTSVGDDRLGGKDIDDLLIQYFRKCYLEKKGQDLDIHDANNSQVLKEKAEEYKRQLSSAFAVDVNIPYLTGGGITGMTLTRGEFESMMSGMLERAMLLVDAALKRATLTFFDIDVILPVGGSSRIPVFRRELERRWGKSLREYDNPDEAVARGAAIAAGIEAKTFPDDSIMIMDVSPHRLGVSVVEQIGEGQFIVDYFSEIIAKDAKLPALERHIYNTMYDGQDTINVRIYEAATESNICQDHRLIGEMPLENIPKASAGQPISIEFRYTLDGTLAATAQCLHAPEVKIDSKFMIVGGLGSETAEIAKTEFDRIWEISAEAKTCQPLLEKAKQLQYERPDAAARIQSASDLLRAALTAGKSEEVSKRLDDLTELLYELS